MSHDLQTSYAPVLIGRLGMVSLLIPLSVSQLRN
jgi:hypothetical protein